MSRKARVRIELPPDAEDTPRVRAKLVSAVAARLGVDVHVGCGHSLAKSENKPAPKLRHRAPQEDIEASAKLYQALMTAMLDDIAAVLK